MTTTNLVSSTDRTNAFQATVPATQNERRQQNNVEDIPLGETTVQTTLRPKMLGITVAKRTNLQFVR